MADNIIQPTIGLNLDSTQSQVSPGQLTYALNAMVEGFDGQSVTYQNEQANELCVTFPTGYKVVGTKNVTSLDTIYYFLTNPVTGNSMIGFSTLNSCLFNVLIDDTTGGSDLLNFNIVHPIKKVEVKTTNCSTQLYWTDRFNPRRYIDLTKLPWKENIVGGIFVPVVGVIDINKMLVQPNYSVPSLKCAEVNVGGDLIEGDYQFAIQYSDALGNGYTSYYSVTNETRIFLDHKISPNFNETTSKCITVDIDKLDISGLYDYYNIAVIKTINAITTVELVTTQYITGRTAQITYTGGEQSKTNIPLTIADIMQQHDYYDIAGDLTQVDNVLVWADLIKEDDISYQKIWNQVPLQWETWRIPYNYREGYYNGANCANIQGYMRDEVYPFEGCFIFANGKQSARFHIPGRIATGRDLALVTNSEGQVGASEDPCNPPGGAVPTWKVYNTGRVLGTSPQFASGDSCYKGPYQYGEMGYHESTLKYPNNAAIWGLLANQPIRHHKFPDSSITHIHDQNPHAIGTDDYNNYEHAIYPIGAKIDINALRLAIQNSPDLTPAEKSQIVGYKIMRGDRINNKAIIAKGLFYNVGEYTKDTSTYYYANYPYNDQNPDPFISKDPVEYKASIKDPGSIHPLDTFHSSRFTFHSPDTHFFRPSGIQGSFVKMETATYGNCKAHFIPVLNNAGQKLRTQKDLEIAFVAALMSVFGLQMDATVGTTITVDVAPSMRLENFFPAFNNMLDILDKLIPYVNYGWQYNSVGFYGNYNAAIPVGNRIRAINYGGYINPGLQGTFGDNHPINNTFRESSVYVSLGGGFAPTQSVGVPADNSRVTASQVGLCGKSSVFYRNISSYYGSIKRYLPAQWGEIFSYKPINTGAYFTFLDDSGNSVSSTDTIFGGDVFINRFALKRKHSFYTKSSVNRPDGTDIDYNQDSVSNTQTGTIGYPTYYYSTSNLPVNVQSGWLHAGIVNLTNALNNWVLAILTAGLSIFIPAIQTIIGVITDGLLTTLGIKLVNMDCPDDDDLHEKGQAYLYAYGVPFFFAESEVNVDMRQATNIKEGNFYPAVASDIPDDWCHQSSVPIEYDNIYTYNKTYSKENKETFFGTLRPDWTPNNKCFTEFNNRAIWSDKSSLEEVKNNWVIYKPGNTFDFPKGAGRLSNIDNLTNNQILVRFQNKTQLYNAMTQLQVTQGPAAYIGNMQMFSTPPLDLSHTDTGNVGSQNAMLLKTDYGNIYADAKRGEIVLLESGAQPKNLEDKGLSKWMYQNLPFNISSYFPTIDTDNNFNGIGLHGVYDSYYDRIIITKKDYEPIDPSIKFDGKDFYIDGSTTPDVTMGGTSTVPGKLECCPPGFVYGPWPGDKGKTYTCYDPRGWDSVTDPIPCGEVVVDTTVTYPGYTGKDGISLEDPKYFCNKSWTLSYSFKTNTWVSWHSYIPDYYVALYSHFKSGKNALEETWDHNYKVTNFNSFYGKTAPYVLEYPFSYKAQDEILQSLKDFTTVRKYIDYLTFFEPDETIYFNKSVIYNGQQCTGVLNLVPKVKNSLAAYMMYPKYNLASKDIVLVKSDNFYNYNTFWDIVNDKSQPIWITGCHMDKEDKTLNQSNMDYSKKDFRKAQIRAKDCKVRHILDDKDDVRLVSKFIINNTVVSYK